MPGQARGDIHHLPGMDSDENLLASHGCNDAYRLRGSGPKREAPASCNHQGFYFLPRSLVLGERGADPDPDKR